MGISKFYFYPYPAGPQHLVTISLDETIAELYCEFEHLANQGVSHDGGITRSNSTIREKITIQRDRLKLGEDVGHKFRSLQNHLDRGGVCSFTVDHEKTFCGFLTNPINAGSQSFKVGANPFFATTGNNTLSPNDYITFETQNPALKTETNKVNTASVTASAGGTITTANRIDFNYPQFSFVRYYRYFPILKRPLSDIGKNIITNEHGLLWSLDITLVVDYAALMGFVPVQNSSDAWSSGVDKFVEEDYFGSRARSSEQLTLNRNPRTDKSTPE